MPPRLAGRIRDMRPVCAGVRNDRRQARHPVAGSAGCSRHLRADHGNAPDHGAVPVAAEHRHRPGAGQHQPGLRIRAALVGAHATVRRRHGRQDRCRARALHRRAAGRGGHLRHALHDQHLGPDPGHWCAVGRRGRHGRPCRADGRHHAAGSTRAPRLRDRHRQRGRLLRPVCLGANRRHADGEPGLGLCHAGHRAAGAAMPAGRLRAARPYAMRFATAAICCWAPVSSPVAFTSRSWPRTCRVWSPRAVCPPYGPAGRWPCWASSTSSAA